MSIVDRRAGFCSSQLGDNLSIKFNFPLSTTSSPPNRDPIFVIMPFYDLHWKVVWQKTTHVHSEPFFTHMHTPLHHLTPDLLYENGSIRSLQADICRSLNLVFCDCKVFVEPWDMEYPLVDDNISFAELLSGGYGEISPQKPITFRLFGAWSFPEAIDRAVLLDKIERIGLAQKTQSLSLGTRQGQEARAATGSGRVRTSLSIAENTNSTTNSEEVVKRVQSLQAQEGWLAYDPHLYETTYYNSPQAAQIHDGRQAAEPYQAFNDSESLTLERAPLTTEAATVDAPPYAGGDVLPPPYTEMAEDWAAISPPTFAEQAEVVNHGAALSTTPIAAAPANTSRPTHPFEPAPVRQRASEQPLHNPVPVSLGVSLPGAFPVGLL
jgi:hypothetical protein